MVALAPRLQLLPITKSPFSQGLFIPKTFPPVSVRLKPITHTPLITTPRE